jgi:DNA invertase Pin-like site-specific DNA recombinase
MGQAKTALTFSGHTEFQRMIKDSAKGLFDVVIVWKLDRFSRDRYDSAHYKRILRKNGVKVVSAKENISDGPEGIILESMLEGYAEYYSAELSEKIHRGQKDNALKGKNNGGGIPIGYLLGDEQKLVIDPLTAPIVLEIFKRYADGETVRSIVEDLNSRGLQTKRNKPFSMNSFNALLKNRKYIGEYQYQDVVIPGGVPAIVPEELFYRVQERMEKNKRAPARSKAEDEFLLTTKLFCGKCERMMVGESGTSHTGKSHYYYKCGNAKRNKGCKKKAVKKDWIERIAVIWTVNRVLRDDEINRIATDLVSLQDLEDLTLPALRRQLEETEKGIENMLNAIQQGVLTSSTKSRLEELERQKTELDINILQTQLQRPRYTKEVVVDWISQFKYGDVNSRDYQMQIIDTFINSIYLFDDKIVFTYNFKGGTETISLADIEAVLGSDLIGMSPSKKGIFSFKGKVCLFLCKKM